MFNCCLLYTHQEITGLLHKVLSVDAASVGIPAEQRSVYHEAAQTFLVFYEQTIEKLLEANIIGRQEQLKETQPPHVHSNHIFKLLNPPITQKGREKQAKTYQAKRRLIDGLQVRRG